MSIQQEIIALQSEQTAIAIATSIANIFADIDISILEDEITDLKIVQLCLTGK